MEALLEFVQEGSFRSDSESKDKIGSLAKDMKNVSFSTEQKFLQFGKILRLNWVDVELEIFSFSIPSIKKSILYNSGDKSWYNNFLHLV